MQPLPHRCRSNIQLVTWNRFLRLLAVGRYLFVAAGLGQILCFRILVSDYFTYQEGLLSYWAGLSLLWSSGLTLFALLDARSRFQDYKRAKDLFFENGFRPRIAKLFIHSRCQRDAARVAAKDLGLLTQLDHFYQSQGYRWYHILPDFVCKRPWLVFTQKYWRKTLFQTEYTSTYFLW